MAKFEALESKLAELEIRLRTIGLLKTVMDSERTHGCTLGCTGACPDPTGNCTYGCTFGCTNGCGEEALAVPAEPERPVKAPEAGPPRRPRGRQRS